jgi:hypothetical protein
VMTSSEIPSPRYSSSAMLGEHMIHDLSMRS